MMRAGRGENHQDASANANGLFNVVGDEQDTAPLRFPDAQEFASHRRLGLEVERSKRFIHQHHGRFIGQHSAKRNAMAHPAR